MLVINATNVVSHGTGLSRFCRNLAEHSLEKGLADRIYVSAGSGLNAIGTDDPITVFPRFLSPRFGVPGHFFRQIFSEFLPLYHSGQLVFQPSPLEGSVFAQNQVVAIHDLTPLLFPKENRAAHFFFRFVLPYILRSARGIITSSKSTQSLLLAHYTVDPRKVRQCYLGLGAEFYETKPVARKKPYVLYVGRDTATKNLDTLIQAFQLFKHKQGKKFSLILAGGDIRPGREGDGVKVRGRVNDDDLRTLYRHASLLVFPSVSEGFGFPALEAFALGCPVLASRIPVLKEICGDAARFIDPDNAQAMAKEIDLSLRNRDATRLMARRKRQAAKFHENRMSCLYMKTIMSFQSR